MAEDSSLQTGYLLTGPPGSGKSTFIQILSLIAGKNCASFDAQDLDNGFVRSEIHNKHIIFIHEVTGISSSQERWLKMLQVCDAIPGQTKYVPSNVSMPFDGITVMTSNDSPSSVIVYSAALLDKFIPICFHSTFGNKDSNLLQDLTNNLSGIINFGLSLPSHTLTHLTRANVINRKLMNHQSLLIGWCEQYLKTVSGEVIDEKDAYWKFKSYAMENDEVEIVSKKNFLNELSVVLNRSFHFPLLGVRKRALNNTRFYAFLNLSWFEPGMKKFKTELTYDSVNDAWEQVKFSFADCDLLPVTKTVKIEVESNCA